MKHGVRKDANHSEVQEALRSMGLTVYDISTTGGGVPDCVVWVRDRWELVEIKNPKTAYGRRGLNPVQRSWVDRWPGGPVYILHTVEEAISFARGDLDAIVIIYPTGFRGEMRGVRSVAEAMAVVGVK